MSEPLMRGNTAKEWVDWIKSFPQNNERPITYKRKQPRPGKGTPCCWCGLAMPLGVEHIIPRGANAPATDKWNLAWACYPCNTERGGDIGSLSYEWLTKYRVYLNKDPEPTGWLYNEFLNKPEEPSKDELKKYFNPNIINSKLNNLRHWLKENNLKEEASLLIKLSSNVQNLDIEQEEGLRRIGKYNITSNTFTIDGGHVIIWERSPFAPNNAHSIYEFVVDEDKRGQGIGTKLIEAVLEEYKNIEISGQVSSLASLKILYNKGFRNVDSPDADFEELKDMFNADNGSLNMRINFESGNYDQ